MPKPAHHPELIEVTQQIHTVLAQYMSDREADEIIKEICPALNLGLFKHIPVEA
jgi:hypothetical protein